ncbi:hypothetical protein QTP88_011146 [Uroleucon formosanum]
MEQRNIEQRYAIKFCVKLGDSVAETYDKLVKVFGDEALSRAQAFRWHNNFKNGRESVGDEPRSGRPVEARTDNVQRVRTLVRQDRRLTVRMLADELNLKRETVRKILTDDLSMKKLCTKMVPKNLLAEQKHVEMSISQDCLEQVEADPTLLDRVITGDEGWYFQYDPETKRQSQQWLSPGAARPKKARMSKSKVKTMMICFFDKGIVHKEFVPPGQTVNQHFYLKVLDRLRKRVIRVRPEIAKTWILHHDNAPCHRAFSVSRFLTSKNIAVLPQAPYSPDMSPCDFFLFPQTKLVVKGTHFESITDIQNAVTRVLQDIPVEAFQKCYESWKKRWNQYIHEKWIEFSRRYDEHRSIIVNEKSVVCSAHFAADSFNVYIKNTMLKSTAIPSLIIQRVRFKTTNLHSEEKQKVDDMEDIGCSSSITSNFPKLLEPEIDGVECLELSSSYGKITNANDSEKHL